MYVVSMCVPVCPCVQYAAKVSHLWAVSIEMSHLLIGCLCVVSMCASQMWDVTVFIQMPYLVDCIFDILCLILYLAAS